MNNIYQISERYKAIGIAHYNMAKYDSASFYLNKADSIYFEMPVNRLTTLSWLAIISMKSGNEDFTDNYINYFNDLIVEHDPINKDIISMNWNMYQVYLLKGNQKLGKEYLENAYLEIKSHSKNIKNKADRNQYLSVNIHQNIADEWNK